MKNILYILIVILCSCVLNENQKQKCNVDLNVSERYDYHFNFMKDNFKENKPLGNNMLVSLSFMTGLTGIKSNVNHGDISLYNEYTDFEEDMERWAKWFSQNKCSIARSQIDSLELKLLKYNSFSY